MSIITVCYNAGATIESTIRSVLGQDHKDIEYIVIDGKSADGTISLIEKYRDRIAKFISEKDDGMYPAINKGIKLATGEVIGILNADDFYAHDGVIARVVREFLEKKTDSVYGDLQYMTKDARKVMRNWKSRPYHPSLFLKGWMPPHPTFFVKRECYAKFGGFNTQFTISSDYELMLRFLFKEKISSSYIPEVLVKMRTGGLSNVTWKSRVKANKEDRLAWKVNQLKPTSFTLILKPLSKLRQFI